MLWRTLILLLLCACPSQKKNDPPSAEPTVTLTGVSPRTVSNATGMPVLLVGKGFKDGHGLRIGVPFGKEVPIEIVDDAHATARLPADLHLPKEMVEATAPLVLVDEHGAQIGNPIDLVVINDLAFEDVWGLVATKDLSHAFTASLTTDELFILETATGTVERIQTSDGPWAIAKAILDGAESAVIAHQNSPELLIVDMNTRATRKVPAPAYAHALIVNDGVAYVAEHAFDTVQAISLVDGKMLWRSPVRPNSRGIAIVGDKLAVGSLVSGEIELLSLKDGSVGPAIAPRPGMPIIGGHTEPYSKYLVGSRGIRALASWNGQVFVASNGPNVGPNPDKMGVTGTGGIGVVDPKSNRYLRHLGFNYGVPQALAVDEKRRRAYVADVAEGLIHVVDLEALTQGDANKQRAAWLGNTALSLPPAWPLFRAKEDFGIDADADLMAEGAAGPANANNVRRRRAGIEIHTGPSALALSEDGKKLLVLERFTGRITTMDATGDLPTVTSSVVLFDALAQRDRRLGQVLYFADLGRTGMSCDSCHLEGHTEGVFYTKTGMMRLWRSTSIRGARDTPPYFNPPAHPTFEHMADYVGGRNRFQNPPLTTEEIDRLALFARTITNLPNPYRGASGALVDEIDGVGRPKNGLRTFYARCAGCHPPPLFSSDQDESTRRRFIKIDTPEVLELRVDQQDTSFKVRTPPSLVGAWDAWPMMVSGAAGFHVVDDHLEARDHSALRAMFERYMGKGHGNVKDLPEQAQNDLLAFVLSL